MCYFQKSADLTQKEIGILSGRVYCQLILVPGSGAFNIFHPELYEKTVDFLKWFTVLGNACWLEKGLILEEKVCFSVHYLLLNTS